MGDLLGTHSCDNPPCCNPTHIVPGTLAFNAADRDAKGRQARGPALAAAIGDQRGENNGRAKLTNGGVIELRRAHAEGKLAVSMAVELGLHVSTVCRALSGARWSHVTDDADA